VWVKHSKKKKEWQLMVKYFGIDDGLISEVDIWILVVD
jgi:hypothetical protein